MTQRTALLIGSTGLIGGHCLRLLLQSPLYTGVHAVVRRPLEFSHDKLTVAEIDFTNPLKYRALFAVDDVFCCFGSTLKKAGSKARFREIDFNIPLALAQTAANEGASRFFLVSSVGASPGSRNNYLKVKGDLEQAIADLSYQTVHIFRPSMLLGDRQESRPAEAIGSIFVRGLAFAMVGPMKRYRAVAASRVAESMLRAAEQEAAGLLIHESETL